MKGLFVVVGLVLVAVTLSQELSEEDIESQMMGKPALQPELAGEIIGDDLVNGDFAGESLEDLVKGPKVNGGFAMNLLPKKKPAVRIVSNADCAGGRVVDGRCLRPFPKPARKATIQDNMASPEQASDASYEADIHRFVQKHFGQKVMEETPEENHHVSFPGLELIDNEMNKNGNEGADIVMSSMFPVGEGMMMSGDQEVNVDLSQAMKRGPRRVTPQLVSETASSKPLLGSDSSTYTPTASEPIKLGGDSSTYTPTGDSAPVLGGDSSTYTPPAGDESTPLLGGDSSTYTPPTLLGSDPSTYSPVERGTNDLEGVKEEEEDVEETIPTVHVDEEPGLPPTPTPTPTPNMELIEAAKREAAAKQARIDTCIAFLDSEKISCSGAEGMAVPDEEETGMSNVQTSADVTSVVEAPSTPAFDVSDVKGNLQAMLVKCTEMATKSISADVPLAEQAGQRSKFAQTLVKYSSALSCLDSEDFPKCMPSEATEAVKSAPTNGEWSCY